MTRIARRIVTGLTLGAAVTMFVPELTGQGAATPEARLEQALHQETVVGDLQRAIALYRDLVAKYPQHRGITARALIGLGRAYEKLGSKEARAAYERVVRDYADQAEPAQVVRGRLQQLAATAEPAPIRASALSLVFAELPTLRPRENAQYDLSPDGERIVYRTDVRNDSLYGVALMVSNSGGTVKRTLVPARHQFGIATPRWSPDGKHIVFLRRTFTEVDSMYRAIVVIPAEGGAERVLNDTLLVRAEQQAGLIWTPDSRAVTVVTNRALVTLDLSGRVIRSVPMRFGYLDEAVSYSPDGRWLAMHRREEGSEMQDEQDVWLLPAEGGRAIQVTHEKSFDGWPYWSPDGRSLFFVSNRSGSHNIWRIDVDPASGLPRGAPKQLTNYTDALILHPRPVKGGRTLAFTLFREATAIHVGPANAPASGRVIARGERPVLSPDGKTVFYLAQGPEPAGIFAVPAEGGTPRRLTDAKPSAPAFAAFAVAPSGDALAYFTRVGSSNVLFTVPASGGAPRELVRFESRENLTPSWSPDGRLLAYSHANGLYAIPAAGGEPVKLSQLYGWDGWTVQWSPNGEHLAALAWTAPNSQNAVFVVPARGGEAHRLTPESEAGYKEGLLWHPDGQRLSYMDYGIRNRFDGSRVAYLDGRPSTLLVDLPKQWDYVGNWDPSGRGFYFISASKGGWDLFGYDDKTGATRLVIGRGDAVPGLTPPTFSRDGSLMTWSVRRTTRQVWTIELAK